MNFIQDLKLYYKSGETSLKIIFWTVGISAFFLITKSFFYPINQFLITWLSLTGVGINSLLKPWTYITYAFIHANFIHLLSNIIMLHFASKLFYTFFKNIQFITVFFGGIIFAGIVYVIASNIFLMNNVLVGASAGILAVIFAVVSYNPQFEVRLLLIGNVKLWIIGFFLILFFLIQIPTSNVGGHVAHFGGLFFGWMYTKLLLKNYNLDIITQRVIDFNPFKKNKKLQDTPFKKVYTNSNEKVLKNSFSNQTEKQKKIDDILDKISKSGYDSLNQDEKDFLFRAGKN